MKHSPLRVREIAVIGALAALSTVTQLIHLGYQSPQWGMWIDIVAVSWFIAFFLFGTRSAFIVSAIGALMITLFAPDTWLGAGMKWLATAPIWISLSLGLMIMHAKRSSFINPLFLIAPLVIGIIVRCLIIIPVNYYYAIPIWTKMTPSQAMTAIPWYIIALFNIVQTILDVGLAWIIVYRFKLSRYAKDPGKEESV